MLRCSLLAHLIISTTAAGYSRQLSTCAEVAAPSVNLITGILANFPPAPSACVTALIATSIQHTTEPSLETTTTELAVAASVSTTNRTTLTSLATSTSTTSNTSTSTSSTSTTSTNTTTNTNITSSTSMTMEPEPDQESMAMSTTEAEPEPDADATTNITTLTSSISPTITSTIATTTSQSHISTSESTTSQSHMSTSTSTNLPSTVPETSEVLTSIASSTTTNLATCIALPCGLAKVPNTATSGCNVLPAGASSRWRASTVLTNGKCARHPGDALQTICLPPLFQMDCPTNNFRSNGPDYSEASSVNCKSCSFPTQVLDMDPTLGSYWIHVSFGPYYNVDGTFLAADVVSAYRLHWVDSYGRHLSLAAEVAVKISLQTSCCHADAFAVTIMGTWESDFSRLALTAVSADGHTLPFTDFTYVVQDGADGKVKAINATFRFELETQVEAENFLSNPEKTTAIARALADILPGVEMKNIIVLAIILRARRLVFAGRRLNVGLVVSYRILTQNVDLSISTDAVSTSALSAAIQARAAEIGANVSVTSVSEIQFTEGVIIGQDKQRTTSGVPAPSRLHAVALSAVILVSGSFFAA